MVPGQPTTLTFTLGDKYHTFLKGHRVMVQIQSSWFPMFDRNPQTFVDIYHAKDGTIGRRRTRFPLGVAAVVLTLPVLDARCKESYTPARLFVGADPERDLADDLVGQQRIRRMEASGAAIAEQPLELALLEHPEAARQIERAVGDAERGLDDACASWRRAAGTSRGRRALATSRWRSLRHAAPSPRCPS